MARAEAQRSLAKQASGFNLRVSESKPRPKPTWFRGPFGDTLTAHLFAKLLWVFREKHLRNRPNIDEPSRPSLASGRAMAKARLRHLSSSKEIFSKASSLRRSVWFWGFGVSEFWGFGVRPEKFHPNKERPSLKLQRKCGNHPPKHIHIHILYSIYIYMYTYDIVKYYMLSLAVQLGNIRCPYIPRPGAYVQTCLSTATVDSTSLPRGKQLRFTSHTGSSHQVSCCKFNMAAEQ